MRVSLRFADYGFLKERILSDRHLSPQTQLDAQQRRLKEYFENQWTSHLRQPRATSSKRTRAWSKRCNASHRPHHQSGAFEKESLLCYAQQVQICKPCTSLSKKRNLFFIPLAECNHCFKFHLLPGFRKLSLVPVEMNSITSRFLCQFRVSLLPLSLFVNVFPIGVHCCWSSVVSPTLCRPSRPPLFSGPFVATTQSCCMT